MKIINHFGHDENYYENRKIIEDFRKQLFIEFESVYEI